MHIGGEPVTTSECGKPIEEARLEVDRAVICWKV